MKYFKILVDLRFIGVGTSSDFRRYQSKYDIIIVSEEKDVQYIQHDEKLYRDYWMKTLEANKYEYKYASVIEIEKEEYDALLNAEVNEEIVVPAIEAKKPPKQVEDQAGVSEIDFVKNAKINKLRADCQNAIVAGFDLVLSDGEKHHFSMETTDQMEINRLVTNGDGGEVIYHADGEEFKKFSFADILKIYNAMNIWRLYHTSYFSDLKSYVSALRSMSKIDSVEYGDEVPEKYQSDIYKEMKDKIDF